LIFLSVLHNSGEGSIPIILEDPLPIFEQGVSNREFISRKGLKYKDNPKFPNIAVINPFT
jgi:hypothetical protein